MITRGLSASIERLAVFQDELREACTHKPDRWRHDVLRLRRGVSDEIGSIGTFIASEIRSDLPTFVAFRNAFSLFRSVVAELQASWPAVSLDPEASSYKEMVSRVRSNFDALRTSVTELERSVSVEP